MRPIYPALAMALVAVALAAPPTHAGPLNSVIPDAAGGYDDPAQTSTVIPDAAGGYDDAVQSEHGHPRRRRRLWTAARQRSTVIPDAAGGYDDARPAGARFGGMARIPVAHTPPVLGVAPRAGEQPGPSDDGLPWEVLAAALAGGTLVLTATGVLAAGRRRAPRARTVA